MISTRIRKQGDSLVITIPEKLRLKEGEEFLIIKKENGTLALIPKVEDFFESATEDDFYLPELAIHYTPQGSEMDKL